MTRTAARATRLSLKRILLYTLLGVLALCFLSGLAVYLSMPYGMPEELIQISSEMAWQRFFPSQAKPVSFPPDVVQEAAVLAEQADSERLMADLQWLADDARQGRLAGSPSEDEVGKWLAERFQTLGLRPFTEAGLQQFAQPFPSALQGQTAENMIGVLPGSDADGMIIILSAHYDHVGVQNGQIYNGADDDATGVAAVLEAARVISTAGVRPRETIVFVLFSAEESGRRGSSALGRLLIRKGLSGRSQMLNLEVLGAAPVERTFLDVWDEGSHITGMLTAAVQTAGQAMEIPITRLGRDPSSDATRMIAYGIPAVTIDTAWNSGESHSKMHTPADDADTIDAEGFLMATRAAIASAWILANDQQ